MIPKIIHYCWFGGNPLPEMAKKCIASWKKFCPDYEIKEWNDTNYDINAIPFTKSAYAEKKFAFVPEYARFKVVYDNGGIYLDNDVELLKSLGDLLNQEGFIGTEKFGALINSGSGYGAIKHSKVIKELMGIYENMPFENEDGVLNMTPGPSQVTPIFIKKGWKPNNTKQIIDGMVIYPTDYFCPKDYDNVLRITPNTYSIHHFAGSWVDEKMKADSEKQKKLARLIGAMPSVYVWYLVKIYRRKGVWGIIKRSPHLVKKFFNRLRNKSASI